MKYGMASRKKTVVASGAGSNAATSNAVHPQHREIAVRAYEFFVQRGGTHGRDLDDWLQAERELLASSPKKAPRRRKPEPVALHLS